PGHVRRGALTIRVEVHPGGAASTSHTELIMFPRDALTTISQTQVRAVNSRQPSSRSRANDCGGRLTCSGRVQRGRGQGEGQGGGVKPANPETPRIKGEPVPRAGGDDENAPPAPGRQTAST